MSEFVLTPAERVLLGALNALGGRYLIVGMGAALIEGAYGTTQDLDLWFGRIDETKLREAARQAGGLYTSGFGMQPATLGGEGLDRVDLVVMASGLGSFDDEYSLAREYDLDACRSRSCRSNASLLASEPPAVRRTWRRYQCWKRLWRRKRTKEGSE